MPSGIYPRTLEQKRKLKRTLKRLYKEGIMRPSYSILGEHHSRKTKKKISIAMRGDKNPSKRLETRKKMSKTRKKRYKEGKFIHHFLGKTKENCKALRRIAENNRKAARSQWKNLEYRQKHTEFMKKVSKKLWQNPEWAKKQVVAMANGRHKNHPYFFLGVAFDSKEEAKVCENFYDNLGFRPEEGINTHVIVGRKIFDFLFVENKTFIEYHPYNKGLDNRTSKQYYGARRKILNENGFKNYKLILITRLRQLQNTI